MTKNLSELVVVEAVFNFQRFVVEITSSCGEHGQYGDARDSSTTHQAPARRRRAASSFQRATNDQI